MGKATIVGDNQANHELLSHGENAWFVTMNDSLALAEGIKTLLGDKQLRAKIGENARSTFMDRASIAALDKQAQKMLAAITAA